MKIKRKNIIRIKNIFKNIIQMHWIMKRKPHKNKTYKKRFLSMTNRQKSFFNKNCNFIKMKNIMKMIVKK